MKKRLLVSGCSFTDMAHSWGTWVAEHYDLDLKNLAVASQGNGLISRKLIHDIDYSFKNDKKFNPDEILVGIMWSAADRSERMIFSGDMFVGPPYLSYNPTHVVPGQRNWRIMSHEWVKSEDVINHYTVFNNSAYSLLLSIEHILRVQWYLEERGIKYFMSSIFDLFKNEELLKNPEIEYLYKQINFDRFLPINGCYEWVKENYVEEGFNPVDEFGNVDLHPTKYGHQKFTNEIIIPFIEKNELNK